MEEWKYTANASYTKAGNEKAHYLSWERCVKKIKTFFKSKENQKSGVNGDNKEKQGVFLTREHNDTFKK